MLLVVNCSAFLLLTDVQVKGAHVSLCLMFQPLSLCKTGGACATHSGDYEIGAVSSSLV